MKLALLALALGLAGCAASLRVPAGGGVVDIKSPNGKAEIIETPQGETVIEEPAPEPEVWCQARARFFRGMVPVRCADIARMIAP